MRSGTRGAWGPALLAFLLPGLPGAVASQGNPGTADSQPPGRLVTAELTARIEEGGRARVEVSMELDGLAGRESLPLEALAFGGVPRELTAALDGGPPASVELTESRPAFWEGRVPLGDGTADAVRLRLAYRVDGAVERGSSGPDGEPELALPWVVVPWAPVDGAPDRVLLRIRFPTPVVLAGSFPAGLRASGEAARGGAAEEWLAGLPVLPALTRSRVEGIPPALIHTGERVGGALVPEGGPPSMPPPGFVFTGLFLAFGAVTLAYLGWMIRAEGRA